MTRCPRWTWRPQEALAFYRDACPSGVQVKCIRSVATTQGKETVISNNRCAEVAGPRAPRGHRPSKSVFKSNQGCPSAPGRQMLEEGAHHRQQVPSSSTSENEACLRDGGKVKEAPSLTN